MTDFATVSKGTSAGGKPRAALKQALFNQGVSDKNPVSEVCCICMLSTAHNITCIEKDRDRDLV